MNNQDNDRLIGLSEMSKIVGFGKTKIYEMINEGVLPAPVKINRSSRWVLSEVYTAVQTIVRNARESGTDTSTQASSNP